MTYLYGYDSSGLGDMGAVDFLPAARPAGEDSKDSFGVSRWPQTLRPSCQR